jgi:hypothetical protein
LRDPTLSDEATVILTKRDQATPIRGQLTSIEGSIAIGGGHIHSHVEGSRFTHKGTAVLD